MVKKVKKKSAKFRKIRVINRDNGESMLINVSKNICYIEERTPPTILTIEELNKIKKYTIRRKLNNQCYFCAFNQVIEKHHIIPVNLGGKKLKNNILNLCPNHHYMIHRKGWELIYYYKWFFLINRNSREIMRPNNNQYYLKRKCPIGLIKFDLVEEKLKGIENVKE